MPLKDGVKKVELYKSVWTRTDKILIFSGLVLLSCAISWEGNMVLSITPNVTSMLGANHISSILYTIVSILQTALLPMYSKLCDRIGRAEAYTLSIVIYSLAFIIMAVANSYATLMIGQIIYAFGSSGTMVLGPILIGDMTSVANRGFFRGLYDGPSLVSYFLAPYVAQVLLDHGQWRWVYGMLPILMAVMGAPLLLGLWHVTLKVDRINKQESQPLLSPPTPGDTGRVHWVDEVDLVGSILLVAALCLTLIPPVLAVSHWGGWQSPTTLGALFAGLITWIALCVWETRYATRPLLPVMSRLIWPENDALRTAKYAILILSIVTMVSAVNWQFFTTFLQVTRRASPQKATYLERGYSIGFILVQMLIGYLMKRFTKRWRVYIFVGVGCLITSVAMMIYARSPDTSDFIVAVSQTLAGVASGIITIPSTVTAQSCVSHDDLAIVTALLSVGGSIAASVGSSMAGAIWNTMLPTEIVENVPGDYDLSRIIADIDYILSLPSEQFDGVVRAYTHVQKTLSMTALLLAGVIVIFALRMRPFGLQDFETPSDFDGSEDNASVPVLTASYDTGNALMSSSIPNRNTNASHDNSASGPDINDKLATA
ncbi:major facilitator superfamily domain-containing protein [Syncephalastrum racemosum]|uniref:Major facilitator superfamily domain-containing protein n=1 Tax=Syncephalastrum racemosum TaxID=13706 RepID=A0A1X2HRZ8_SYNRA|nr:major facilitator superfamily domain-containing protein [Syncephalastrum racemosum]